MTHAIKLKKLLHFDFYFKNLGYNNMKYELVLKDDRRAFIPLRSTESTTTEEAADCLIEWVFTCNTDSAEF